MDIDKVMARHYQPCDQILVIYDSIIRVFDTKNAGFLSKEELCRIMKPWMSRKELDEMVKEAQGDHEGLICYEGTLRVYSTYLLTSNLHC